MNLSSRLDAARRQREQEGAKRLEPHPLDLRYVVEEGQTYDGRELRTGDELTPEKWAELRQRDEHLPTWRPEPTPDDTFADSATLIDLTTIAPASIPPPEPTAPMDPAIEFPAWASPDAIAPIRPIAPPRDIGNDACVNCGGEARVDVLDMLSGVAHLECTGCGFKWKAHTEQRAWPGRP